MRFSWLSLPVIAAVAACSSGQPDASPPPPDAARVVTPPRFDTAMVEAMKIQLRAEIQIKDLLFDPKPMAVTWQIALVNDGSRQIGYAQYVCLLLHDAGLVDRHTDVRIVDYAATRVSGDFRATSLGHVRCADDQDMGV